MRRASLHWASWRIILPPPAYTGGNPTGAGSALKAARRINQKATPVCATFHREPRQVGFRTFFLSAVGVTNTGGIRFPAREQTVGRIVPLKCRSVYGLRTDRRPYGMYG